MTPAARVPGRAVETESAASVTSILTWWKATQARFPKRRLTWHQRFCRHSATHLSAPVRIRWTGDVEWITLPRVVICDRCDAVIGEASDA